MIHDDHVRCSTVYWYILNINIHDVSSTKIYNRLFDTIIVFTIMFFLKKNMRIMFYLLCLIETSKMYIENSHIEYVQETHVVEFGVGFNVFIDHRV